VFSILRSQKLNLKENTASLLEVESGSNDPVSYMLTAVLCTMMSGQSVSVTVMLVQQILFGVLAGILFGKLASNLMRNGLINKEEGKTVFVFSMILLSYSVPVLLGGNGYLSVYLCGMIMGNEKLPGKRSLVHFFDSFTQMAQIMIFFLLGLLVTPNELPQVFVPALLIMVFMTLVSRPISVSLMLLPFKAGKGQIILVSWAGLRGAASIVFAIMAVLSNVSLHYNLFNLVFCIVLLSISIQGSLLPFISRKLFMIDNTVDVYKTFNDYEESNEVSFINIKITANHEWINQPLNRISLPKELLITLILRDGNKVIPNGNTTIQEDDLLVIAGQTFVEQENLYMQEIMIDKEHRWSNQQIKDLHLDKGTLIVLVERGNDTIIPDGKTIIKENDMLVVVRSE